MFWLRCRVERLGPSRQNYPGKIRRTMLKLGCWISNRDKWLRPSNSANPPSRSPRVYRRSKTKNIIELNGPTRSGLSHLIEIEGLTASTKPAQLDATRRFR